MTEAKSKALNSAEVSAVIIRACTRCSHPRQADLAAKQRRFNRRPVTVVASYRQCAGCGNPEPPEITDAGLVAAAYKSRWRRVWWKVFGDPRSRLAQWRVGRRTRRLERAD